MLFTFSEEEQPIFLAHVFKAYFKEAFDLSRFACNFYLNSSSLDSLNNVRSMVM